MPDCPFCSETVTVLVKPCQARILGVCTCCMNPLMLAHDGSSWHAHPPKAVQDVRMAASEGSIGGDLLKLIPAAMERLPILPEIAQRILVMVRDPDVTIEDLVRAINQDQVVALKILKLANSPVYGGLTEIKQLDAACVRLGMKNVAGAVHAIANGKLYVTKVRRYRDMMQGLWRHSLAVAHCAGEIGILLAEPRSDVLFVAGLIHDVGKVLLLDVMANLDAGARTTPPLETLRQSQELLDEYLKDYHALIGLHIAQHWNLPPEFSIATFCHSRAECVPDDTWLSLVHIVSLASAVANASGFGIGDSTTSLLSHPSAKFLGLNDLKLACLRVDLEDRIAPFLDITAAA